MKTAKINAFNLRPIISKKLILKTIILLPLLFLNTLACQAHETDNYRVISTNGVGIVEVKPDQVAINLTAKALRKTAKFAKDDVDTQVNKLLDEMEKIGIKKADIVASTIRLNPRYEHRSSEGPYFTGYEAQRNISITLHQLEQLATVMDKAIETGINIIENLSFESSKEELHMAKARELAIADSRKKAEALAKAYGAELGAIHTINYHSDQPLAKPSFAAEMPEMAMLRSASRPAAYLPDSLTFQDNIQVTFDLIINH